MQSYLQYRYLRSSIHRLIGSDREKHAVDEDPSSSRDSPAPDAVSNPPGSDLEKEHTTPILSCAKVLEKPDSCCTSPSEQIFIVSWNGPNDPANPRNFSIARKMMTTLIVGAIALVVGAASATDAAIVPQAAEEFHVSDVAESLATGIYLMGYAFGAVLAAPFSEIFGRNLIYISTLILFAIFILGSALAPNFGGQVVLRFLAGFFGSTPLVCAGGSIADLWDQMEKTYAFPIYAIAGFGGPVLGPVMASYVAFGSLSNWRWAEWISLIIAGLVLVLVLLFMPETFGPLILQWKAQEIRKLTSDERYKAELEVTHRTLSMRMKIALTRPFVMATEPIVILMTLYITVLYIVLFTFLDGYTFIFKDVYGISQGLTNVCFLGIYIGTCLPALLIYPIYRITEKDLAKVRAAGRQNLDPEVRLWFGMLGGSISIPVSLFWMGWTDYPSVSIWSPLIASALFGCGVLCVFLMVYMYVIDSYEIYAASALTLVTFVRYLIAGVMTVVGIPFYRNMGSHWTLTIMACISALLVPLPFVFYKWGPTIRSYSKHAAVKV
ncbi:major facilitator superfamily domain-containing protein [Lipomyces tetrasporus]